MLVKHWMTKELVTAVPQTQLAKAVRLMRRHNIRCLPVLNSSKKVVGIITDRDLKAASPSKATTLDAHELHYLFSDLTAADIMTREVVTISPDETVEKAAVLMQRLKISSLPVVENGVAQGIITQNDLARVLATITGITLGGTQFALSLDNDPDKVGEVVRLVKAHGASLVSMLTIHNQYNPGRVEAYIRTSDLDPDGFAALKEELARRFRLVYVAENEMADLEQLEPAHLVKPVMGVG